jgi:parallel beta-helix repeat protein
MNRTSAVRIGWIALAATAAMTGLALLLSLGNPAQASLSAATARYVASDGLDSGNCQTVAGRCRTVQYAVNVASPFDQVWVAGGTYTSAGEAVITVTKSITLYGGWDGASVGVRDPAAYPTVLDGENARRVIQITGNVSPTIDGFTITRGNATNATEDIGLGGGILSTDASPIIQNNVIVSNTAGITPTSGNGGGIYLSNAPASTVISGNLVLSNVATIGTLGSGGGIYLWQSDATVRGNLVQGNTCTYYGGGMRIMYNSPRLIDNEIRGNVAGRNGGGIYMNGSLALVQGNLIVGNMSGGDGLSWNGGGILITNGSPTITANRILSNAAGSSGGLGLETSDYFTVTNNVIAHNNSEGIMLWDVSRYGLVAHNTIAYNGYSGGVYLAYGYITPTIVNNIIVSNTYGINAHTDASGTLDYNDVWGNTTQDYDLPGALEPGPHDIQADPHFVSAAEDNYHLHSGSLCINAGMNAGVTTDIDGQSRPDGIAPDIGADEYIEWHIYLPVVLRDSS